MYHNTRYGIKVPSVSLVNRTEGVPDSILPPCFPNLATASFVDLFKTQWTPVTPFLHRCAPRRRLLDLRGFGTSGHDAPRFRPPINLRRAPRVHNKTHCFRGPPQEEGDIDVHPLNIYDHQSAIFTQSI